ncbi:MAG: hypothetical protein JWO07_614 [Candidatus Saccharibacteria bacterium]|nr:hypothetical protein [Candidatus Saccharibacteria bacterium]
MTTHPGEMNPWAQPGSQGNFNYVTPQPAPQNVAPVNPGYGPNSYYGNAPQAYPQGPQIPNPNAQPNNPNAPKSNRTRNVLIGLATASVLGTGAALGYGAIENGTEKGIEKAFPNAGTDNISHISEAPTPPEYVGNLKISYAETPAMETMNQLAPQWAHDLPLARTMIIDPNNHLLTDEQTALLSQPLPASLANATSQQLENISSYQVFDATSQGNDTPTLGRQFLGLALDPRNPHESLLNQDITDGKRGEVQVIKAISSYPEKTNFTFEQDQVADGWVVEGNDVYHGGDVVSLFEKIESSDGTEHVVLRDSFDPSDPEVQSEINRLFGN